MNFAGECKSKVNLFYTKDSFGLCLAECISSLFYIHTFFLPYFFIIFAEDKLHAVMGRMKFVYVSYAMFLHKGMSA
jgi:hypothetical protein